MRTLKTQWVPLALSRGGSCLTAQNWEDTGISVIACSLEHLLFKPGLDLLWKLPNLKSWLGWTQRVVLNATMAIDSNDNSYALRSPWDGSKLQISLETLSNLVKHLEPDYVVLPDAVLHHANLDWPDVRFPLSPFLEVDEPAEYGFQGLVYTQNGVLDLKENTVAQAHISLENTCNCTVCKQSLTRAYLHHLYLHTPLLAQRFLIVHNVSWYIKNY